MIPKRIICTNICRSLLKPKLDECVARMEALHPDWEVVFFSDGDCRDLIQTHCPQYKELYDWYPRPVLKADFFRVAAVHALGGFYFDTDLWLYESVAPLRKHEAVFPWEWTMDLDEFSRRYTEEEKKTIKRRQVGNYAFGAEAGHPFLRALMSEMVARTEMFDAESCYDTDVLHATGPDMVTCVYYREPEKWRSLELLTGVRSTTGPQHENTNWPEDWHRFGKYGIHLLSGTWRGGR
jgi:mannosyltransferase OCH1-like enzyme